MAITSSNVSATILLIGILNKFVFLFMTNSLSMFFSSRLSIYYTHGLCKEKKCFISAILPIPGVLLYGSLSAF